MKKIVKIAAIVVAVVLVIALVAPMVGQDRRDCEA